MKGDEHHSFVVYPVYEGKSYDDAVKLYKNKFDEYQSKLKERLDLEKKLQLEYEAKVKKLKEEAKEQQKKWEEQNKKWKEQQEAMLLTMQSEEKVLRVFQINNFGIWNCDCPQMLPQGNTIAAKFCDDNGAIIDLNHVYLVEKNRNAIFTRYYFDFNHFQYNPAQKNMIWAVTSEKELAVFSYDDFATVPNKPGTVTFKMKLNKLDAKSVTELKKILKVITNKI